MVKSSTRKRLESTSTRDDSMETIQSFVDACAVVDDARGGLVRLHPIHPAEEGLGELLDALRVLSCLGREDADRVGDDKAKEGKDCERNEQRDTYREPVRQLQEDARFDAWTQAAGYSRDVRLLCKAAPSTASERPLRQHLDDRLQCVKEREREHERDQDGLHIIKSSSDHCNADEEQHGGAQPLLHLTLCGSQGNGEDRHT
eukprot:scaffold14476_cov120-Isochrysis_galbana.AAC.7